MAVDLASAGEAESQATLKSRNHRLEGQGQLPPTAALGGRLPVNGSDAGIAHRVDLGVEAEHVVQGT